MQQVSFDFLRNVRHEFDIFVEINFCQGGGFTAPESRVEARNYSGNDTVSASILGGLGGTTEAPTTTTPTTTTETSTEMEPFSDEPEFGEWKGIKII